MEKKRCGVFLLWGVLGVAAMMPASVFAAPASKCGGNGVENGAALQQKVRNGVCGNPGEVASVPEPSGLALLAAGLIAVGASQMRKSRNKQ